MVIHVPYKYLIPAVIVLLAAGVAIWYFFIRETEEMKIRKQLAQVILLAEKKADTSFLAAVGSSKKLEEYFTPNATVEIQYGVRDRFLFFQIKDLIAMLLLHKNRVRSLHLSTADITVTFPEVPDRADLEFTVQADLCTDSEKGTFREIRSVKAKLVKDKERGSWLFDRIRAEEIISL